MSVPRADLTATLLPKGDVLLVGGETTSTSDTATVDLYDQIANTVRAVAPMKIARNGHTATLLPNGKVLVAGGSGSPGGPSLSSTEIYDPASNTWATGSSMSFPRSHHAAVLMTNGKVLVIGGSNMTAVAEVYDPGTNTWTSVTPPNNDQRPFGPTATLLQDHRVMIVGGGNSTAQTSNSDVWLYDPVTGQMAFSRFHPERGGANFATATLLPDGKVLVAGGESSTTPAGPQSTTDIYDPSLDSCTQTNCSSFAYGPTMNVGHCHHTMTTLNSGLVLVAGGRCGSADSIAVSELYDPSAKRWWPAGAMQDPRGYHAAVLLIDGRVLVAGGIFPGGSIASATELYLPG